MFKSILLISTVLAANSAFAALGDLPLLDASPVRVNSTSLVERIDAQTGERYQDLMANVTVTTGCFATQDLVKETQITSQQASYRLLAAVVDGGPAIHCFAIGYRNVDVRLGSFAEGQVPRNIVVNGQTVAE